MTLIPRFFHLSLFIVGLGIALAANAQDSKPAAPDSIDKDYSAELPRIAPLSPAEALKSFEVATGFKLELAAAEPLVADPVAICFDENSRMYVVEMRGYSENRDEKISEIRLLEDTDDDGKYEKSTVFADKLNWPTAIHCWQGGVFVADAPDLIYLKDTTGDGIADERKVVLTGFGTSNVQGLVNTFQWSLGNHIAVSLSSTGAELRKPDDNTGKPISLRGRDFEFDPRTMEITAITGGAQHGATTDRWGNRFVCSNSDHIQHCVFEDRYLARNPYLAASGARRSIAVDGPQADVFRISPVEPWRIVRTRLRASKIVPGIVEGGGRPSGYFTSATGVTIYDGDAWPSDFNGLAFIGDVGSNIVHRKQLKPNGVSFTAHRIDEKKEFIASRDTWFRPVQFANAPDGNLYLCDMYRETIEHPLSIPPILKKHLDLTSGRDKGRIYRVVHELSQRRSMPKLGQLGSQELLKLLDHPNGWHRQTAARLLSERDQPDIGVNHARPLYRRFHAEGRIQLLYTLATEQLLEADDLLSGLNDEDPRVREHAVRLAEPFAEGSPAIRDRLVGLVSDGDMRVRFQLAFALGGIAVEQRAPALFSIFQLDGANADIRAAILSSLNEGAGLFLSKLAGDDKLASTLAGKEAIRQLVTQIGKQQRPDDIALLVQTLARWSEQQSPLLPLAIQSLAARQGSPLAQQIAKATGGKADEWLRELTQAAKTAALDASAKPADRLAAVRQLRVADFATALEVAQALLIPAESSELQLSAIALIGSFDAPEVAGLLLAKLDELTPATKGRALDVLTSRPSWSLTLMNAVEHKTIAASDLDQTRWKLLTESSDEKVRQLATKLSVANRPSERNEVLAAYRSVLESSGDAARGKEVFKKNCSLCHKVQGVGHDIGPNLAAMKNRGAEAILVNVLDPNREVNPQYLNYLVLTSEGRTLSGILTGETATSITLKRQENATDTVLRVDIESLKSTGQSLMPVGVEKQIDKAAMADLLEYLKSLE